jgi:hypothetical protein
VNLISNLSCYIFSWTCISLSMYKLPCLWDEKYISIIYCTLCCISTRVTLFALFSHPFGSMSRGIVFIDNFVQILGCLIALPINVFQGSIIVANNILYLTSHSFIMGILDIMYYIICGVWNYVASSHNNNPSFYYIFLFILLNCNLI